MIRNDIWTFLGGRKLWNEEIFYTGWIIKAGTFNFCENVKKHKEQQV